MNPYHYQRVETPGRTIIAKSACFSTQFKGHVVIWIHCSIFSFVVVVCFLQTWNPVAMFLRAAAVLLSMLQCCHLSWCPDTQKSQVNSQFLMTTAIQSPKTPTFQPASSHRATTYQVPECFLTWLTQSLFLTLWLHDILLWSDYPRNPSVPQSLCCQSTALCSCWTIPQTVGILDFSQSRGTKQSFFLVCRLVRVMSHSSIHTHTRSHIGDRLSSQAPPSH